MAGKPKRIDTEDLGFIKTYIGGRILNDTFADLLVNPDQRSAVQAKFELAARAGDLVQLNEWLDQDVTAEARKVIWAAARGRAHRRRNPRSEYTLSKKTALAALQWADTDDIDRAVLLLLQAVDADGTKR